MNNKFWWIVGILAVILVVGGIMIVDKNSKKSTTAENTQVEQDSVSTTAVTKTYTGTLPCADCSGIETTLSLTQENDYTSEGTFEKSETYLGRSEEPIKSTGNWTTERGNTSDPDATIIVLNPQDPNTVERYLQVNATTLEKLDQQGNEIQSDLNYTLTLQQ